MNFSQTTLCALSAAHSVSPFLLEGFGSAKATYKESTGASALTKYDTGAEERIIDILHSFDPTIDILAEESGGGVAERFWTIDPIDGTGNFVRGLPFCTTMISLIEEGVVTSAVINNFVTGEVFVAEKGKGAYRNWQQVYVSQRPLSIAYLSVESQDREFHDVMSGICNLTHVIACGWEMANVACGKSEGRIMLRPWAKLWDIAPGSLLVSEAGGVVRNLGKNNDTILDGNFNLLATNQKVAEELLAPNSPIAQWL